MKMVGIALDVGPRNTYLIEMLGARGREIPSPWPGLFWGGGRLLERKLIFHWITIGLANLAKE